MSKVPTKKWQQDSTFKLRVCMMEMNVTQEYEDIGVHNETYKKKFLNQIETNADTGVIGKLQRV